MVTLNVDRELRAQYSLPCKPKRSRSLPDEQEIEALVRENDQVTLQYWLPLFDDEAKSKIARYTGKHNRPGTASLLLRHVTDDKKIAEEILNGAWNGDQPEMIKWVTEKALLDSFWIFGYISGRSKYDIGPKIAAFFNK